MMHDIRLKLKLLEDLIKEILSYEKRPFLDHTDLICIENKIQEHSLLSEFFQETSTKKLVESWKSTVDNWVKCLMSLMSSKMPDKCWVGICLVGRTIQYCSPDRFLASFTDWFEKLLPQIQSSDSHFVTIASCASFAELFIRLSCFPNVKKNGVSLASKLIQPLLNMLAENVSEALLEGALNLFITVMTTFPSSVLRYHDNVERAIVSKIFSAKLTSSLTHKFSQILALLPHARGDHESWSLLFQKNLLLMNTILDDAFEGLEQVNKATEAMRLLTPPGKDPPLLLRGPSMLGNVSTQDKKWFDQGVMHGISILMKCCSIMLTDPYPVQVTVPAQPLLALVERVLSVDGSFSQASQPFVSVMQKELVCSKLPVLHSCSLDLLLAFIDGVKSHLLPHALVVMKLVKGYFRTCLLPSLRIKCYSIMQDLLVVMGLGISPRISEEIVGNALVDLNFIHCPSRLPFSNSHTLQVIDGPVEQPSHKKMNLGSGPLAEKHAIEVGLPNNKQIAPISVQIAALNALKTLIDVGGTWKSEGWRSKVDFILLTVAKNASKRGFCVKENESNLFEMPTSTQTDFRLAALRALLSSLLSPIYAQSAFFSEGLELFRQGRLQTESKVAQFCTHALSVLEVRIHPRALSLSERPSANMADDRHSRKFPFSDSESCRDYFAKSMLSMDDFELEDDLKDYEPGDAEEEDTMHHKEEQTNNSNETPHAKKTVQGAGEPATAKLPVDVTAADHVQVLGGEAKVPTVNHIATTGVSRNNDTVEPVQLTVSDSCDGASHGELLPALDANIPINSLVANQTSENLENSTQVDTSALKRCSLTSSRTSPGVKRKGSSSDSDSSSLDSLPDVVVADPDSDSD